MLIVQIPVGLNILIPVIVYSCIWFVPESPRWLVSKHRDEKAVAALIRINASDPNYSPTEDIEDIRADHEASIAEGSGSWGELFTNPVEFRKLVAVFGILAGQQITGVQFIFSCTSAAVGHADPAQMPLSSRPLSSSPTRSSSRSCVEPTSQI